MDNATLLRRSLASVWHPCTQMKHHESLPLVPIQRGHGVWLYDFAGKRYLDAVSSWWVNLFGHCNPKIGQALKRQLDTLEHAMLAGFTHEPVVELSERLQTLAPNGLGHCFYGSDGASATEIALKMSFHYWRNHGQAEKNGFISLQNGYHGETIGALAVTDVAIFRDTYAPLLRQTAQLPSPDSRLAAEGESAHDYALRCADALEIYLAHHGTQTAAFILEPLVQGAAGMGMYPPIYLQRARALCTQYHVHLIADEIAVGFGRTGTLFACEQADISPDFLCLSKGLTGGYLPLSVVMTQDEIYQAFYHDELSRGFLHSHSYTGSALACRAALATLDIFAHENTIHHNRETAAYLSALLSPIHAHPRVKNFRHLGMIWAFELETTTPDFSRACFQAALKRSVLLRPIGQTIYLMPPYVINHEEMLLLAEELRRLVEQFAAH